jgi:hypothetical protein
MSAPASHADVLKQIADSFRTAGFDVTRIEFGEVAATRFAEALASAAELIEADHEVDAAQAAIREKHKPGDVVPLDDPMVVRIVEAEARRAAALKGVQS